MATILISDTLITAWEQLALRGDKSAISTEYNVSYYKVNQALKNKIAEQEVFDAIKNFYLKRSEFLKQQNDFAENLNIA